ncbi:MAG TPA: ferrochelatase [Coriobacteriia bacterium]|nr:ferrochelatase [Coriobacteriia bacterium]
MPRTGVLITGYGGPDSVDAVGPFMCNLMGREPSEELLARVCRKYLAIGGASPLTEIASAFATKLETMLAEQEHDVPVEIGMRYWQPYISDGLARLRDRGCERVIVLSLSAFEAQITTESYRKAVAEAATPLGLEIVDAPLMSESVAYTDWFAASAASALQDIEPNEGAIIAFTAHSLPHTDLVENDPYVAGLERVANQVAKDLGLEPGAPDAGAPMFEGFHAFGSAARPRAWFMVYQSKGERPGAWLGPDLDELLDQCAESGVPAIVVVPIGFATDHMETLYDLDIVSADHALQMGVEMLRAPVPNEDDTIVTAMVDEVVALLG